MLFFESVLEELGKKIDYQAVVNYAGNSFCEKSWDMIMEANPMVEHKHSGASAVAAFFDTGTVVHKTRESNPEAFGPI